MSTYLDVVNGEVFVCGKATDVGWAALRELGSIEDILDRRHMTRCYRHVRIWQQYVQKFAPERRVRFNLTQVVWANRFEERQWQPNDPPDWDQEIVTVSVNGYDKKKYC